MDQQLNAKIEAYLHQNRSAIVEDLKTLVRIRSVSENGSGDKPFGEGCAKVLNRAVEMAREKGLTAENHGGYYGTVTWGTGDRTIGIFSHLDVVPEGNGWQYDPFNPVEKDGYIIGRGASDNKSAAVLGMHVMKCLESMEVPFRSKVSLYLGCSEETGMNDIGRYVQEQPMPDFSIVPDTNFPVCHGEKGILQVDAMSDQPFEQVLRFSGGLVSNMVADHCEALIAPDPALMDELRHLAESAPRIQVSMTEEGILVEATGVAAHASLPQDGINAIHLLTHFLSRSRVLCDNDRHLMAFIDTTIADNGGEAMGVAFRDEPSGPLTCICGVCSTDEGRPCLDFNIRYPVTDQGSRIVEGMRKHFFQGEWKVTHWEDSAPAYVPKDDPMVVELSRIYHEITGADATPYTMGGGTYARKLRNAVGFGMESDQRPPMPAGHGGVHQPDEAQSIEALLQGLKIYVLSILEIDKILHR